MSLTGRKPLVVLTTWSSHLHGPYMSHLRGDLIPRKTGGKETKQGNSWREIINQVNQGVGKYRMSDLIQGKITFMIHPFNIK